MHGAGAGVEGSVMLPGGLAEAVRICGELVPKTVEIDALATGNEPFHIRAAEAEMPEQRVLEDLLPGADAGDRSVDQRKSCDPVAVLGREREADHVADIVRDQIGLPYAE